MARPFETYYDYLEVCVVLYAKDSPPLLAT